MQENRLMTELESKELILHPEFKVTSTMTFNDCSPSHVISIKPIITRDLSDTWDYKILARHYNIQLLQHGVVTVSYLGGPLYQLNAYKKILDRINQLDDIQHSMKMDFKIRYNYQASFSDKHGTPYGCDQMFTLYGTFDDGQISIDHYADGVVDRSFTYCPEPVKRLILDAERIATVKINRIYEASDYKTACEILGIKDPWAIRKEAWGDYIEPQDTTRMTHSAYEVMYTSGYVDAIKCDISA